MISFLAAFALLIGHEGGLSLVPSDPGNWTGGAVGKGKLVGTKFGISAAAFPTLDIPNLSLVAAQAIYRAQYWMPLLLDSVAPQLALLVFDSAVNNGVSRAARLLQAAVHAKPDGIVGTATIAAINRSCADQAALDAACAEFQAQRVMFMAGLSTWSDFGLGWSRRLCALPFQAVRSMPVANSNTVAFAA